MIYYLKDGRKYYKNGGLIRKMQTAAGGNLFSGEKGHSRMVTTGGAGYILPHTQLDKATIRQNLYDNLSPHSYQSLSDAFKSILGTNIGATHTLENISINPQAEQPINDAIWATYLGIPKSRRHKNSPELAKSKYTPSKGKDNVTYYKFPLIDGINYIVEEGTSLPIGSNKVTNMDSSLAGVGNVGNYTIGHGYDKQGEYVSVYDKWDINPFKGSYKMTGPLGNIGNLLFGNIDDLSFGIGKPVHLYDRIYLDDYYGVKEPTHATYLPEIIVTGKKKQGGKMNTLEFLKNGSGIHIKKKNRGKFTAYCGGNVTSACIAKAKASGNPTLVKRATFAANARKWKHLWGGIIGPAIPGLNIIDKLKGVKGKVSNYIRLKLYDRVDPYSYDIGDAISQLIYKGRDTKKNDIYDALWARYLKRSNSDVGYNIDNYLQPATYKPNKGTHIGQLYRLTPKSWDSNENLNPLGDRQLYEMLKSGKTFDLGDGVGGTKTGLGTYTRSLGQDEKGKYMSYYDEWDISPIGNKQGKEGRDQTFGIGTPFSVYDRRYYTDEEAKHIISEYDKMFKSISNATKNLSIKHEIYSPKPYKKKKGGKLCLIPRN